LDAANNPCLLRVTSRHRFSLARAHATGRGLKEREQGISLQNPGQILQDEARFSAPYTSPCA